MAANSVHVMKMCDAFAALGHRVTLFAKQPPNGEEPFGFYGVAARFRLQYRPKSKHLSGRILLGWRIWRWFYKRQVLALNPDLLYGRDSRALSSVCSLGVPFVIEAHGLPRKPEVQERLFKQPNFRRLVVISHALEEDYLAAFSSLDKLKVLVAPDAASPPSSDLPQRPLAPERLQVGYAGNVYPGRGIHLIMRLAERCPWADFHVLGGKEQDLAARGIGLASAPNLTFHGFIPHGEVSAHLAAFDILLAPYQNRVISHGGGNRNVRWMSPLKIFEYMAHGKSIIASDLPVLREILENGRNALLVPPNDIDAWMAALGHLRDDAGLREQLGQGALRDFEKSHSWFSRAKTVLERL